MTEGLNRSRWAHTATLMAHLANIHRDPKRPAYTAADFNPTVEEAKESIPMTKGVGILKVLLGPNPRIRRVKATMSPGEGGKTCSQP